MDNRPAHLEGWKLTANCFNALSGAFVAGSVVAPLVQPSTFDPANSVLMFAGSLLCHVIARLTLYESYRTAPE